MEAIPASVSSGTKDHLTCVAIAMLAAWERRSGDAETYQVHMNAWKRSAVPPSALEESSVGALMDDVWLGFRENLFERSEEPRSHTTLAQSINITIQTIFLSASDDSRSIDPRPEVFFTLWQNTQKAISLRQTASHVLEPYVSRTWLEVLLTLDHTILETCSV